MDVQSIVEQLKGIRCPSTIRQPGMKCTSCPDAIAKTIEKVYRQQVALGRVGGARPQGHAPAAPVSAEGVETVVAGRMKFCPECGARLEHEVAASSAQLRLLKMRLMLLT